MIYVLPVYQQNIEYAHLRAKKVSTVSHNPGISRDLSPFTLGPCELYGGFTSRNMENAWQYSKVYAEHMKNRPADRKVSRRWWDWAEAGWNDPIARRYPMGHGAKPLYSYWDGRTLDYITARKVIYGPLYAEAVQKTDGYRRLKKYYEEYEHLILLDYDAYDHHKRGMSLTDVLNFEKKKMGHAFVLAMLLTNDPALEQMELRS